jgi:hypothetical protein
VTTPRAAMNLDPRQEAIDLLTRALDLELPDLEREAFSRMLRQVQAPPAAEDDALYPGGGLNQSITPKQRQWIRNVIERFEGKPSTRLTDGPVPRGRPVETPAVLRNLPKAPPGRRAP